MSKESPEVQELFDQISACLPLAVEFEGAIFRSAGVRYANEADFISGEGAGYFGGRWNPPRIKAVYGSLDPVTAAKESYQEFTGSGFIVEDIQPRVIAGVRVKACRLLDLTDKKVRRKLGFSLNELVEEDWRAIQSTGQESWTQAIGRGCGVAGFEGLIVPSVVDREGKNVVIFPDRLATGSSIGLIAKGELPPHPSQWSK